MPADPSLPILDAAPTPVAPSPVPTLAESSAKTCKDADASEPSRHSSAYFRSLEQMQDTEEYRAFLHREFPAGASVFEGADEGVADDAVDLRPGKSGISRRRWMQIMGASASLAAAGCRWEPENIVPLTYRPEDRVPGRPQTFATAWELAGVARPLLAQSIDGRPIKLEGNPEHPDTRGGTDMFDQGLLLAMYDPDRSRYLYDTRDGERAKDWPLASAALRELGEIAREQPESLAVLCEPTSSVILQRLRDDFQEAFPGSQWVTYSAVNTANQREGLKAATGQAVRPVYDLSQADVVVSLDADPLGLDVGAHGMIRDWASRRTPESNGDVGGMNRTYAFESGFSGTGMSADHRAAVKSSHIGSVLDQLASGGDEAVAADKKASVLDRTVNAAALDLAAAGSRAVVVVGAHQPAAVHAAAARLNEQLGAVGTTVRYLEVEDAPSDLEALSGLAESLVSGRTKTLVILGGNPVYDAPADLNLPEALAAAETIVRWSMYPDETAQLSHWLIPATHPMEEWNLLRSSDGTLTTAQPMIPQPVIEEARPASAILQEMLGGTPKSQRELFYEAMAAEGLRDAAAVQTAVHAGFVEGSAPEGVEATASGDASGAAAEAGGGDGSSGEDGIEVVLLPSPQVYDGRFANNGWLQETPAPISRTVWGNYAAIAPSMADDLGVEQHDLLAITVGGATVEVPAYVLPGQAPGSIALQLGYGRRAAGVVGGNDHIYGNYYGEGNFRDPEDRPVEPVGVDVTPLKTTAAPSILTGATVKKTGGERKVVTVQDHFTIDTTGLEGTADRIGELVREGSLDSFEEDEHFAGHLGPHHPALESLWTEWDAEDSSLLKEDRHRWGMAIDLSKCVGCGSCVTACTSENNIPVVGPDQVDRGREMHWLRVDRYFAFGPKDGQKMDGFDLDKIDLDNPRIVSQPVACHHCETAPCEQVCPVAATVHSYEGLNDMVYNRCIGTRYCANNCPYKVRRFNFFNYNKRYERDAKKSDRYDLQALVLNPEVTVRARGVMEKCTYCVQRIKNVTQYAKNEQRDIRDGEIVTACQAACPADAIVFGDLVDNDAEVTKWQKNPRAYAMLAELNVKPRTRYLARIRNLHPALGDLQPQLEIESHGHGGEHGEEHGGEHHDEHADGHHDEHEATEELHGDHAASENSEGHHVPSAESRKDSGGAINDEMVTSPGERIQAPE